MPLNRRDRFALKSQMVDVINEDRDWTFQRTNMLLTEYGCSALSPYDNEGEFTFADSIKDLGDADLLEMFSLVTGVEPEAVQSQIETVDSSLWKPGYVRLFVSHSAVHKKFIGQVADEGA